MNIEINGKTIEIYEEGFLVNINDWNDEVCSALIKQQLLATRRTHMAHNNGLLS